MSTIWSRAKGCLLSLLLNPYTIALVVLTLLANFIGHIQDDTWEQIQSGNYKGRIEMPSIWIGVWLYKSELTEGFEEARINGGIDNFEFSCLLAEDADFREDVYHYLKIHNPESYWDLTVGEFERNIQQNDKYYRVAKPLHSLSTPHNKSMLVGLYNFYGDEKGSLQDFSRKLSSEAYRKLIYENLKNKILFNFNRPSYEEFSRVLYNKPNTINIKSAIKDLISNYSGE